MSEQWLATRYPGYSVSDFGRVRGPRGSVLSQKIAGKGYPAVTVTNDQTAYVHQMVCEAFHGPRPSGRHQVGHGNGNPADNRAVNLRWVTPAENTADAVRHGTCPLAPGGAAEDNGNARLSWEVVERIRSEWRGGATQASLARKFAVGKSQVHNIVRDKQWRTREEWKP